MNNFKELTSIGEILQEYSLKDLEDCNIQPLDLIFEYSYKGPGENESIPLTKEEEDHHKVLIKQKIARREANKTTRRLSESSWSSLIKQKAKNNKKIPNSLNVQENKEMVSKVFNISSITKESNSSLHYNLQASSSTLSKFLLKKDSEKKKKKKTKSKKNPELEEKMRAIKVRIYPSKEKKETYKKLFGYQRKLYNSCLEYIKNNNGLYKLQDLRENFVKASGDFVKQNKQEYPDVPNEFRDNIVLDLIKNIVSNEKKTSKTGKSFTIKRKTKKLGKVNSESFGIQGRTWNKAKTVNSWWFKTFKHELKFKDKTSKFPKINHDIRFLRTSSNKYYICIPISYTEDDLLDNQDSIVTCDPGERVFLTARNTRTNSIDEIGTNIREKIEKLLRPIDFIKEELNKKKDTGKFFHDRKKRYKLQKVKLRRLEKIQNVVSDFHKVIAKNFCENNSLILIPKLNFHFLRNLNKRSKRVLQTISHCKLVDRLKTKSQQYKNCNVQVVREDYTSKTCSNCGNINYDLGSSKYYVCSKIACGFEEDRDHNATNNILYKFLNEKIPITKLAELVCA